MRWCSGKGKRLGYDRSGFNPGLRSSFFFIETPSIRGQINTNKISYYLQLGLFSDNLQHCEYFVRMLVGAS